MKPNPIVPPDSEKEQRAQMARDLLGKHASLADALVAYGSSYADSLGKLRTVMIELKKADLSPREQTLVLEHVGFTQSRQSEIKKIVNDTPERFKAFITGDISFRVALAASRNGDAEGGEGGEGEGGAPGRTKKKAEASPGLMAALSRLVNGIPAAEIPKGKLKVKMDRLDCKIVITFAPLKVRKAAAKKAAAKPKKKAAAVKAKPVASKPAVAQQTSLPGVKP